MRGSAAWLNLLCRTLAGLSLPLHLLCLHVGWNGALGDTLLFSHGLVVVKSLREPNRFLFHLEQPCSGFI